MSCTLIMVWCCTGFVGIIIVLYVFCTIHFFVLIDCIIFYLFIFIVLELMIGVLGLICWNIWYSSFRSGFGIIVVFPIFVVPLYFGILIFPIFVDFSCIVSVLYHIIISFIDMIIIWICNFGFIWPMPNIVLLILIDSGVESLRSAKCSLFAIFLLFLDR